MSVWIALLRGINVGGKNIIPMRALAATFTRLGFESVKTFIASGNVLFRSPTRDPRALERRLEKAIAKAHGCAIKVVVRSREELAALADDLPRGWKKPSAAKRYYVLFLRHEVDSKDILDRVQAKPGIEEIAYRPGALLWSATIAGLTRSSVMKLTASPLYKDITIRNLATTLKVRALADAMTGDVTSAITSGSSAARSRRPTASPARRSRSSPRPRARTSR
jgi:uncharacterized protein (DUF1697 family)